jgi:hypothetical protein
VSAWAKAATKPTYTASEVGAAATGHKHSAADITSGTLPVARGGTGQTSLENVTVGKSNNVLGQGNLSLEIENAMKFEFTNTQNYFSIFVQVSVGTNITSFFVTGDFGKNGSETTNSIHNVGITIIGAGSGINVPNTASNFYPTVKYDPSGTVYIYFGAGNVKRIHYTFAGQTVGGYTMTEVTIPTSTSLTTVNNYSIIPIFTSKAGVGSTARPVYVDNDGTVKPCTYAISTSTTGADTHTIYLV